MSRFGFKKINGFTLIEVLVSMVILAIGLLGLASMQTLSLRDSQNAFFYSQATTLAYEMGDRIAANAPNTNPPWIPPATIPTAAATCLVSDPCNTTAGCTSSAMAAYDYCAWNADVQSQIGSTAQAVVDSSPPTALTSTACPGIPASTNCTDTSGTMLCLTICWTSVNQLGASAPYVYQLQVTP